MKRWVLLMCVGLLAACSEEDRLEELGANYGLVGTWIGQESDGSSLLLSRAAEFDPGRYGFAIHDDGRFTEHKNAGWCATPPISYAVFEGSWTALSDSLLDITVGYWGGTMTYQIRVMSVSGDELRIRYLYGDERAGAR